MKFFFPDSQDLVDPTFDFDRERRSVDRLRQRDDLYAHEVFRGPAFDGLLVSKGIVDGFGVSSSRYSMAQRHRLLRLGAPEFFRVNSVKPRLPIMGDCGAFTYVKEPIPPYSVDELLKFYSDCDFDLGISLDHVILAYQPDWDLGKQSDETREQERLEAKDRHRLTLELAGEFLLKHKKGKHRFLPVGAAQGWSPGSYAESVRELQRIGFKYIALGGMVPLRTTDILLCLKAINAVRRKDTKLHLLGITRTEHIAAFEKFGVVSFDSTSPLRQAFKDDKDNYYGDGRTFTAIRIPQVEGNPSLKKVIASGKIRQQDARELELKSLAAMKAFDVGKQSLKATLSVLMKYEQLYNPESDHTKAYRETLEASPWKNCACDVCRALGHHVILFRGAERNRRRGFHNLWVFYRQMRSGTRRPLKEAA